MHKRITWTTTYNIGREETGRYISEELTFDSHGNMLDHTVFGSNGRPENRKVFRYSEVSGLLLEVAEYDFLNGLIERKEFFENPEGDICKVVVSYNDGSIETREYGFSDLGKADRSTIYDTDGNVVGEEIFVFDEDENVIQEIEKDAFGNELLRIERDFAPGGLLKAERVFVIDALKESTTYSYNAYGSIVAQIKKDGTGVVIESVVTNYNDQNIPTAKRTEIQSPAGKVIEESSYDETGNVILTEARTSGKLTFRNACTYDDEQRLISEDLLEVTTYGKVERHERLDHIYEGETHPRLQSKSRFGELYNES
jgi:hypothetical protein